MNTDFLMWWGILAFVAIILIALFLRYFPILLWISTRAGGKDFPNAFLDEDTYVPPHVIAKAMVEAHKAGIPLTRDELEAHYLAGGHVGRWYTLLSRQIKLILT